MSEKNIEQVVWDNLIQISQIKTEGSALLLVAALLHDKENGSLASLLPAPPAA